MTQDEETGGTVYGWRMRWVLTKVMPPLIGVAGLIDVIFIREELLEQPLRVAVCAGLIGGPTLIDRTSRR